MSWQEYTALLVFCAVMSFTPGPNTMLSAALSANHGLRRALRFCFAVPVGWTLLMLACALGLGVLIEGAPSLRLLIQWVGVAYLLWLALKLAQTHQLVQANPTVSAVGFWQGATLQFVNIKAWMLALTLTAGWVAPGPNPGTRLLIVCLTMLVLIMASTFSYALMGSLLRDWLSLGRRLIWFNRLFALLLAATAVWMAVA